MPIHTHVYDHQAYELIKNKLLHHFLSESINYLTFESYYLFISSTFTEGFQGSTPYKFFESCKFFPTFIYRYGIKYNFFFQTKLWTFDFFFFLYSYLVHGDTEHHERVKYVRKAQKNLCHKKYTYILMILIP